MHPVARAAVFVAFWAATTSIAWAHIPEAARAAYTDGRFVIAATLAEAEGGADSLAFAARAHTAEAVTRDELCLDCLVKAEATAQAAITRDPNAADGYVQLAVAIGFRGRLLSSTDARSEGLAEKGRAALDRALELEPHNSWARAALGGWHLEIVHRAGSVLAAVLYGAHEEDGLQNFRAAIAEDPVSLLLRYHYALSILALDPERFHAEALSTLEAGYKDPSTDALLAFTRKRAQKLIETLKAGNTDEIATLVHHFQGYPVGGPADAAAR